MAISKLPPPLLKLLLLSSPQRNNETFDVLVPFKLRRASLPTASSTSGTHIPSSKPNRHKKTKAAKSKRTSEKTQIVNREADFNNIKTERKITQKHKKDHTGTLLLFCT
jgi:hypothetical protein